MVPASASQKYPLIVSLLLLSKRMFGLYTVIRYDPPIWANSLNPLPTSVVKLCNLPTPLHRFNPEMLSSQNVELWIKRDDLSSFDLSGNKVRKLEFLLADALRQSCDCVVTIGGIQSNHARATAVAARQLGLEPYLVLRSPDPNSDPGLQGNLMLSRMIGSKLRLVTPSMYAKFGQKKLINQLGLDLRKIGRNPYIIPVGGSNPLGTWGYLECIREIGEQMNSLQIKFDHVVFACGSGKFPLFLGSC